MIRSRLMFPALTALALGIGGLAGVTATSAQAADRTLCGYHVAPVSGGTYTVQNDEWSSSAPECITTGGGTDFQVANSAIAKPTNGPPGGYPSIFMGCQWGDCTKGGLAASPPQVLTAAVPGTVTSSWSTTTPSGDGSVYDAAYDIWINRTPTTSGHPVGSEIMIWLKNQGAVRPAGSIVAAGVWIGGNEYNVWYGKGNGLSDLVSYQMTTPSSAVASLDISSVIFDAELRGYTDPSWYLIAVEAGFEIWRGGAGLATTSFSVNSMTVPGDRTRLARPFSATPVWHSYRPGRATAR